MLMRAIPRFDDPRSGNFQRAGLSVRAGMWPVLLAIVLVASACSRRLDWIEYRGELGSGYTPESIHPPLGLKWKLRLQTEDMKRVRAFNPPIVIDNVIYFGSPDGNFYALDVDTGYMKWIFRTTGAVNSVPFADDSNIYFGSNNAKVYAVSRKDGQEVWRFNTGQTVQSLVLRYKDLIIFTSDTGATYFLNMDGQPVHQIDNPVWSHHTFQVYDGVIYWAPLGRSFGAYDIDRRKFLWNVPIDAPYALWFSFPAIDEDRVYYASSFFKGFEVELNYYALNRKTGEPIWQKTDVFQPGSRTEINEKTLFLDHVQLLDYMAPSLWKDLVIYASGDIKMRAFHRGTGEVAWEKEFSYPFSSAPTVAGDRIYVGLQGKKEKTDMGLFGSSPKLLCLSAKDGSVLWEMETDGAVLNSPIVSRGRIIFGTDKNYFYVLEEMLSLPFFH